MKNQILTLKQQHQLLTLENFLQQFPADATSWGNATDEIMDVARKCRMAWNEERDLQEGDEQFVHAIPDYVFNKPGNRNEAYATQIRALWPELNDVHQSEVIEFINEINL